MVEAHSGTRRISPRGGARAGKSRKSGKRMRYCEGGGVMGKTALLFTSIYAILNYSHEGGGGLKNLELTNPFQLTIFLFISTSLGALGYRNWVLTSFGDGKMLGEKFRLSVRLEGHRDLFTFLAVIS